MKQVFLFMLLASCCVTMSLADEIRPAYLELRQTGEQTYTILFKVPVRSDNQRIGVQVELPPDSVNMTEPHATLVNNAFIERWAIKVAGGLGGKPVHINGLSATSLDVLVRATHIDGTTQVARLTPAETFFVVADAAGSFDVAATYLVLGIEHILAGFDHLLFVLALLLIVGFHWGVLIKTITAFTVAHSITLALATLGVIHISPAPVEAVIALSIMFIAAEILRASSGNPGLTTRAPWLVALVFGLLHGFGFAGALSAIGLPPNAVPLALLFFNLGVEIGQLIFVAAVILLVATLRHTPIVWPQWIVRLPPYVIGGCAGFWAIERMAVVIPVFS